MADYKLTICCVTFNQEKFIRHALDSFLMQKTDFAFQVLVSDDASTDKTPQIIKEYAKKYPDIIFPILHKNNMGPFNNSLFLYQAAKTDYVAICDGDDYWTDEHKLQKQVDFLESHPNFSVCFHPVVVHWDDNSKPDSIFPTKKHRFFKTELCISDLLKRNFIQTNSVMFRWRFKVKSIRDYFSCEIAPGDYYLSLLHAQTGKIAFLPDVMAVYRKNSGSIWNDAGKTDAWYLKYALPYLNFIKKKETEFHDKNHWEFDTVILRVVVAAQRTGKEEALVNIETVYPDTVKKSLKKTRSFIRLRVAYYAFVSFLGFGSFKKQTKQYKRILKLLLR